MVQIKADIDNTELQSLLARLITRASSLLPFYRDAAEVMVDEITENFNKGGRPRWKKSKAAQSRGGVTLTDTAILKNSITGSADGESATAGTNQPYGRAHELGFDGTISIPGHTRVITQAFGKQIPATTIEVKGHSRKMYLPARPFLTISKEGYARIEDAALDHLELTG